MAAKTTSGCGFHFRFVFCVVDFVENEYNIEGIPRTVFEKNWVKVQKFQK